MLIIELHLSGPASSDELGLGSSREGEVVSLQDSIRVGILF